MVAKRAPVVLDEDQIAFLEELGFSYLRLGVEDTARKLLSIVLAWRTAAAVRSSGHPAEVIDIQQWSRKVEP